MANIRSMLKKTYLSHGHGSVYGFEEAEALMRVLAAGARTCDIEATKFGKEFAEMVDAKYAFPVSSCVGALHLALLAAGLKQGDEVIVPAMTFRATANVPDVQGCKVVFCDSKFTFNINPDKIGEKITSKTKAIMPVHMCGQPCEMDAILKIAREHNLVIIEDAAHAAGSVYKGRKIGSISDFSAFSFQVTKNMSTLGEGGMLTVNNEKYAAKIEGLRGNGEGGLNYRMTDAQAAVGRVQLKKLAGFIKIRERNAHYFYERLKGVDGISMPDIISGITHAFHLCNILVDEKILGMTRDEFVEILKNKYGVFCNIQYSPAVHQQDYYRKKYKYRKGDFPVAEELARRVVTLPIGPRMTIVDLDYCINAVKDVIEKKS